jgi:hypothetical protein
MTDTTPLLLGYIWAGLVVLFFIAYWRPRKKKPVNLIAVHIDEFNGGM